MAEFGMWGPQQGPVRVQQEDQLNRLAMGQTAAKTDLMGAQAEHQRAIAAQERQKVAQADREQAAIQEVAMDSTVQTLGDMSGRLMKMGFPVAAASIGEKWAKTEEMKAKAETDRATTELRQMDVLGKQADQMGRLARAISESEDPVGTFEAVKAEMRKNGQKIPPMIDGAQWTPELGKQLEAAALSQKDSIEAKRKALDDKGKEQERQARERLDKAREAEAYEKAKTESSRRAKLAKEGTLLDGKIAEQKTGKEKAAQRTPKEDVQLVTDLVRDTYPDVEVDSKGRLVDPGISASASYVAGEAQKLLRENKALSRDQAVAQAFQAAQEGKVFETVGKEPKKSFLGFEFGGSPGKTKGTPSRVGQTGETKPAAGAAKEGATGTYEGKPVVYKNGKWEYK